MSFQGNSGTNALAKILSERMHKESESPLALDFGSIEADYSLRTNTFPVSIPKSDYTVCRHVGGLSYSIVGGQHGGHELGTGSHEHTAMMPRIKPGDRVLVAWVQNDAVVMDVIVPASRV